MNILSLFDGMSCGQIALERANIKVNKYYASEIDKYAIKVTQHNYPKTIQLGDVTQVNGCDLDNIDLLIGGSPCQGFSFAGKQLNFEDTRSKLFFEYARLLKECKPKYFLLENVRMKQEYQDVISEYLGVKPIMINSALVSAQNRVRLYWTNIPNIEQPEDKGIVLKDVLERGVSPNVSEYSSKKYAPSNGKYVDPYNKTEIKNNKSTTLRLNSSNGNMWVRTCKIKEPKVLINESATKDNKAYALTASYNKAVAWNSCERKQRTMILVEESSEDSSNIYNSTRYRKLTPIECERLQTVEDNYTEGVSNTQRYKMLGNGWTVDVIAHILKGI